MKMSSAFPSKYLRAADIPDGMFVSVKVKNCQLENVAGNDDPNETKPVLYFEGKSKGLVLNKTNSTAIAHKSGDESDDWFGRTIQLYTTETLFQGQMKPCIRVKVPLVQESNSEKTDNPEVATKKPEPVAANTNDINPSEIPF